MRVVYIAGKFTAATQWERAKNIRAAETWGLVVASRGGMPLIPHANTGNFHGELSPEFWYAGTLELMRRCDGILLIPDWEHSVGAKLELAEASAKKLKIWTWPQFDSREFLDWLAEG